MPSTLYSLNCYIKNRPYCLSIYNDVQTKEPSDAESIEFTSTSLDVSSIIPSLTKLRFELITSRKQKSVSKEMNLNHILSVEQSDALPNRYRKNFAANDGLYNPTVQVTEESLQGSRPTLNTGISEESYASQQSISHRQFGLTRFLSTQTNADSETKPLTKIVIILNYVDVLKSIRWHIKKLKLYVESEEIANELFMNLNLCLSVLDQRPRNLLAFVNPFGGKGKAGFIYERKVLPIFTAAKITVKSIYTEHANHARDFVINEDLSEYDGLVCVGGDGMFAELCHGLLLRTSREAHLNIDDRQVSILRPDLRIGIIPAGSTDAVVFGTTGLSDPITSALQIIVGETLSIDIATVHNEKGFVRFMATMLAYGFFGDIIHLSDQWRCLGPLRYDLAGFCQFIRNRSYHSEVTITLLPPESSHVHVSEPIPTSGTPEGETKPSEVPHSHRLLNELHPESKSVPADSEAVENIIEQGLVFCSRNCELCAVIDSRESTPPQAPIQIKCDGRYTTINCLNMPGRCAKSKFGMAPFVHLGDGTADLILVKRSWRTGFLRFLWQVANDGRSIEDLPHVERYRASEIFIRPVHTERRKLGNWACDGELIEGNEIYIRIHRQALRLFASGIQFDKLTTYNPVKKTPTKPSRGANQ